MSWYTDFLARYQREVAAAAARRAAPLAGSFAERSAQAVRQAMSRALTSGQYEDLLDELSQIRSQMSALAAEEARLQAANPTLSGTIGNDLQAERDLLNERFAAITEQLRDSAAEVSGQKNPAAEFQEGALPETMESIYGQEVNPPRPPIVRRDLRDAVSRNRARHAQQWRGEFVEELRRAMTSGQPTIGPDGRLDVSNFAFGSDRVQQLLRDPRAKRALLVMADERGIPLDSPSLAEAVTRAELDAIRRSVDEATAVRDIPEDAQGQLMRRPTNYVMDPRFEPLEAFVPVTDSGTPRIVYTPATDPVTGRPKIGADGRPLPLVDPASLPQPGSSDYQAVLEGRLNILGMKSERPGGTFAGRTVQNADGSTQIVTDFDRPLIPLVKRRTGGDGNRSPESVVYILPVKGGYQAVSIDPVTGGPGAPVTMDQNDITRLFREGYEAPESTGFYRPVMADKDPEAAGRLLMEARRAPTAPESRQSILNELRQWELLGTREDIERLYAASGMRPGDAIDFLDVPETAAAGVTPQRVAAAAQVPPTQSVLAGLMPQATVDNVGSGVGGMAADVTSGPALTDLAVSPPTYGTGPLTVLPDGTRFSASGGGDLPDPNAPIDVSGLGGTVVDDSVLDGFRSPFDPPSPTLDELLAMQPPAASGSGSMSLLDELLSGRTSASAVPQLSFQVEPGSWASGVTSGGASNPFAIGDWLGNPIEVDATTSSAWRVEPFNRVVEPNMYNAPGTTSALAAPSQSARRSIGTAGSARVRSARNSGAFFNEDTSETVGRGLAPRTSINPKWDPGREGPRLGPNDPKPQVFTPLAPSDVARFERGDDVPVTTDPALRRTAEQNEADAAAQRLAIAGGRGPSRQPPTTSVDQLRAWFNEAFPTSGTQQRYPRGLGDKDTRQRTGRVSSAAMSELADLQSEIESLSNAISIARDSIGPRKMKRHRRAGPMDPAEVAAVKSFISENAPILTEKQARYDELINRELSMSDSRFALDPAGENQNRLVEAFLDGETAGDRMGALQDLLGTPSITPVAALDGIKRRAAESGVTLSDEDIIASVITQGAPSAKPEAVRAAAAKAAADLEELYRPKQQTLPAPGPADAPEQLTMLQRLRQAASALPFMPPDIPRAPVPEVGSELDAIHSAIPDAAAIAQMTPEQGRQALSQVALAEKQLNDLIGGTYGPLPEDYGSAVRARIAEAREAARAATIPSDARPEPTFQTDAQRELAATQAELGRLLSEDPLSEDIEPLIDKLDELKKQIPYVSDEAQADIAYGRPAPAPFESRPATVVSDDVPEIREFTTERDFQPAADFEVRISPEQADQIRRYVINPGAGLASGSAGKPIGNATYAVRELPNGRAEITVSRKFVPPTHLRVSDAVIVEPKPLVIVGKAADRGSAPSWNEVAVDFAREGDVIKPVMYGPDIPRAQGGVEEVPIIGAGPKPATAPAAPASPAAPEPAGPEYRYDDGMDYESAVEGYDARNARAAGGAAVVAGLDSPNPGPGRAAAAALHDAEEAAPLSRAAEDAAMRQSASKPPPDKGTGARPPRIRETESPVGPAAATGLMAVLALMGKTGDMANSRLQQVWDRFSPDDDGAAGGEPVAVADQAVAVPLPEAAEDTNTWRADVIGRLRAARSATPFHTVQNFLPR